MLLVMLGDCGETLRTLTLPKCPLPNTAMGLNSSMVTPFVILDSTTAGSEGSATYNKNTVTSGTALENIRY